MGTMIFSGCILVHKDAEGQSSFWAHLAQKDLEVSQLVVTEHLKIHLISTFHVL